MPSLADVLSAFKWAEDITKETGKSRDDVVVIATAILEKQQAEHEAQSTSPESIDKLKSYITQNDGAVRDLSPKDICLNAGVEPNRGNKRWAKKQQALLTHQPSHGDEANGER